MQKVAAAVRIWQNARNTFIEENNDESHYGDVRYAEPAHAAAVWLRLDSRAQLYAAGAAQRHVRQMLCWQYAVYARAPRTAHRALQFSAPPLGANRAV